MGVAYHQGAETAMRLTPPVFALPATERLLLRPLRGTDAPSLFDIFSDRETMRYWSTPPWRWPADAEAFLADSRSYLRLGIARRSDRALIGTCALFAVHQASRRAELGYILGRPHWGQGYAREAVTALLNHGFDAHDLNRIEADADPRNTASVRLLEHLGFVREGQMRERWIVNGEVSDSVWYGLLARDWTARRG
jgi:[ribosomal protein S5]-alanine N-acetyltransferase